MGGRGGYNGRSPRKASSINSGREEKTPTKTKKKAVKVPSAAKKSGGKKKASAKKASAKKASARKAAPKKAAPRKAAARKTAPKKAAPSKRSSRKAPAKKVSKRTFKKEITEKLIEEKRRVLSEVNSMARVESDASKFEIGDIYDKASNERERELTLTLGDRERGKLSEIENALERLVDNTYDECDECGEPIGEDRLRALPFTRVCVECKSRSEVQEHIKGRPVEPGTIGMVDRGEPDDDEF
jgi:DnaK suppressor protein